MPTYEYACDSCGHKFEAFQKMADAALKDCPECGKSIRRVFSAGIGISFKGSGFYVTDSKPSDKPKPETKPAVASGSTCSGSSCS